MALGLQKLCLILGKKITKKMLFKHVVHLLYQFCRIKSYSIYLSMWHQLWSLKSHFLTQIIIWEFLRMPAGFINIFFFRADLTNFFILAFRSKVNTIASKAPRSSTNVICCTYFWFGKVKWKLLYRCGWQYLLGCFHANRIPTFR